MAEFELDEDQKLAVELSKDTKNKIVSITGPAGCGKTTIMKEIYDYAYQRGLNPLAMAPTGKAARRINEATGIDAVTIHRGLEFPHPGEADPKTGKPLNHTYPKRNRLNPLPHSVVLVDEYAMVNDYIHRSIFEAMRPGSVIRFFGDVNQLRPIEEDKALEKMPSAFERFVNNPKFKSVRLTKYHRTGKGASAVVNASRILVGQSPKPYDDYRITYTQNPVVAVTDLMKREADIWCSTDAQAITPTRISWIGTEKLNATLQTSVFRQVFSSTDKYILVERHRWAKTPLTLYVGDKIVITANNYGLNLFNGDIGVVVDIDPPTETIVANFYGTDFIIGSSQQVAFNGTVRTYNPQKDIDLAYVITTHKTQGSEWKRTAYIMNRSCSFMCNRKNLYTGTTRHREEIDVFADAMSMSQSLYKKGD